MRPFRLAGLGRLRKLQEDRAAAELAQRTARRRGAEQRSGVARAQLEGATLPDQADARMWQASVLARAAASAMLSQAVTAVDIAQSQEASAQDEWSVARTRTTTIDKLGQRHALAERDAELRAEQYTLDELAAQRVVQARREEA